MYGYYFDPTYILLIIGMILSLAASARVKSTFAIYSRVRSASRTDRGRSCEKDSAHGRNYRCCGGPDFRQPDGSL